MESVSLEISSGSDHGICVCRSNVPQTPGDFEFSLIKHAVLVSDHAWSRANVARVLGNLVCEHDLGRVLIYDPQAAHDGNPDPSRALTVCFYSYARMPRGHVPDGPPSATPDLVV